ncbi:MAG: hypothetical protein M3Y36_00800 [Actinomycetota bacterium]|nr:hypothetical protein [Actinomycetota bacterium]
MTGVVVAEAVLLIVVGFFAVGLLHSYAGLLRRVQRLERGVPVANPTLPPRLPAPSGAERVAADIAGESLDGETVTLAVTGVEHTTLLAFLSSGCTTCAGFWAQMPHAAASTEGRHSRLVVVTQGPDHESSSALATLASPGVVNTVMSSRCWEDYAVPGSPYFVFVDGPSGMIRGEGTALGWDEVFSLMALAEGDAMPAGGGALATGAGRHRKPASDAAREAAVDLELLRAGIRPGDPTLYPTRPGPEPAGDRQGS